MKRLYYEDPEIVAFSATVTGCTQTGDGWEVTLSATAFYPGGGGQACDTGTLGEARVGSVRESGNELYHLCDRPLVPGEAVEGRIDWEPRFHRMQQHTGEHILSGLIHRHYGLHNVGFHMGKAGMEVDFDGYLTPEQLEQLEAEANRAVWADLPVEAGFPSEEELERTPYRSKRRLEMPVRIVTVPGFDCCACCGTHVKRTGQIGIIKILSSVKLRGGVRLEMVCGAQAYRILQDTYRQAKEACQLLSLQIPELSQGVSQLAKALEQEKFRSHQLEKQQLDRIAESYVNQNNVLHIQSGLEPGLVRYLADAIAGGITGFAAVFSGGSYCIVTKHGDVTELGKAVNAGLQGRGGGKKQFCQGAVQAEEGAIRAFFREYL